MTMQDQPALTMSPAHWQNASDARTGDCAQLAQCLQDARGRTLALFAAFEDALAPTALAVPYSGQLNPPLWELGHIAWFQEWWLARNRERARGAAADPDCARPPSCLAGADALYNSSLVPHARRWHLPLPDDAATRHFLAQTLQQSLHLLAQSEASDDALYFFRLALFHEDMHAEAAVYMAQALGIPLPQQEAMPAGAVVCLPPAPTIALHVAARDWTLGWGGASGFAFDNELAQQTVSLRAFEIDAAPVSWARYLPFVQAGGYQDPRWWSPQGRAWLQTAGACVATAAAQVPTTSAVLQGPRYLRREGGAWLARRGGAWQTLDLLAPAVHLSAHEADAWCCWAGRRLATEAEWECAALTQRGFVWGEVWDWTASVFDPFAGFVSHPYRDYSKPWFGTRRVLKGACTATSPRMRHPKYRNFFTPERNDIIAGFRSCATLVEPV